MIRDACEDHRVCQSVQAKRIRLPFLPPSSFLPPMLLLSIQREITTGKRKQSNIMFFSRKKRVVKRKSLHTESGKRIVHVITATPANTFFVRRCEDVEHRTWSQCSEAMEIASSLWVQHRYLRLRRKNFVTHQFGQPCCYK